MINLQTVVEIVIYVLVVAAVFGLLLFLVNYVGRSFPGETMSLGVRIAKLLLVVLFVLVVIGLLIGLIDGWPMFRWGPAPLFR